MTCKVYCPTETVQDIGVVPTEGYNPYFFPVEGAYLPFFFTDETFVKVLSALVNGAAVTYGDEGRAVVWEFLRNVEFPVNMCQIIADCINDLESPARQAILDMVTSDTTIANYFTSSTERLTSDQIAGSIMSGSCDESEIAGQVLAIVDMIDAYNIDGLEIVEVGTNDEERLSSFISGFPAIGLFPADEALDTMQDWLEDFAENYAAAVTPEWKNEVSEDLYCIAKGMPDCSLTYEALFNYFQDRAGSNLDIFSTTFDVVQFLVDGDFNTDDLVASGMYAVMLGAVLTGRHYFGVSLPLIGAITRDASPSSAWEDWDECDTPTDEDCWDFATAQNGYIPYNNGFVDYATYSAGNGFGVGYNAGIINIRRDIAAFGTIAEVTVRFSMDVPTGVNNTLGALNYNYTGGAYINDVEGDTAVIPLLAITGGIMIDFTFDGTLPTGFYIVEVCVTYAP